MCQIQVRQARDSLSRAGEADYTISQSAIARVGMVRSTERQGFMLTPKGAVGKRVERAVEGERVILHIHGG